ncbi:hypothetical protein FFR93_19080 [Rhizobium sp. MHM7A]|nr:hypothetical protein FFR93_19080 [Rhizobium sp. MHM7A]
MNRLFDCLPVRHVFIPFSEMLLDSLAGCEGKPGRFPTVASFDLQMCGFMRNSWRLVRVLEDWCAPYPGPPFVYHTSRRQMRAFIDFFRHVEDKGGR